MGTQLRIKGKKAINVTYDDLGRLRTVKLPVIAEASFKAFILDYVPFTVNEIESYTEKYKGRVSYTITEQDISFFGRFKGIWVDTYERLKGFQPKFTKVDAKCLNEIFEFIYSNTSTPEEAELIFRGLLALLGKDIYPKWIEDGLSLTTFSAKLNIILSHAMKHNEANGGSLFAQYRV